MERCGDSQRINSGVRDPPSFPILHPSCIPPGPPTILARILSPLRPAIPGSRERRSSSSSKTSPQSPSISASVWIIGTLPTSHRPEAGERGKREKETGQGEQKNGEVISDYPARGYLCFKCLQRRSELDMARYTRAIEEKKFVIILVVKLEV